jgi:sugar phosphate isomerase/epimerase
MKLSTQDKPFFPTGLLDKFNTVKSMGFDAFEIDGKLLTERFDEVRKASRSADLPIVTACGGYRGWIGHFEEELRRQAIEDIGDQLRKLSELSGQGVVAPAAWGMFSKRLPPMIPPRSEEEDRAILLDSLERINRVASETGTFLYLEPLNRYEDYMINTLADAARLIEAGSFSHVKIIADFYHMNIEEARIEASIRAAKKHLGHVHLADSHRFEPGTGHLDFVPGFRALKEIGYDGFLAFECRVQGQPEDPLYRRSVRYIRDCLERA